MGTQVKGQVFTSALAALERLQGPQVTAQLVAALEGDFGHAMRTRSVLAIGWYPLEWYAQLHTAARARCGAAISGPIGRESSIADINTVFRYILKLFSPETLLGQAPRIFHTYCRGDLVLDSSEKGRVRAHCEKCDGANQGVWEDWVESFRTFLELAGARNPQARVLSGGRDGDASCAFELTWG